MQKTAIIVPCYNEELRLNVREFIVSARTNTNLSYFFVNDGSTDETQEKLNELLRLNPEQFLVFNLKKNYGKAEAVRRGFLEAMESNFSYIGYWDADLSTPLSSVNSFYNTIHNTDKLIVLGSRVKLLGRKIERKPLRHYLGRLFATCVSLILQLEVYDTQCGAKLFRNSEQLKSVFSTPFTVKWTFDVEILARLTRSAMITSGVSLENLAVEYPLEEWRDVPGSKVKARDFFVAAVELVKIFLFLHSFKLKTRIRKLKKRFSRF